MSTQLLCPECGHHVGNLGRPSRTSYAAAVDEAVSDWLLERNQPGRFAAAELYAEFTKTSGTKVTPKAFGDSLARQGAKKKRSNGLSYWSI